MAAYPARESEAAAIGVRTLLAAGARGAFDPMPSGAGARPFYHVVAFVPSGASSSARRSALRRQFSRSAALLPAGLRARLFFVLGTEAVSLVKEEDAALGDLLFVPCADVDGDSEPPAKSATTCKIVRALHYASAELDFLYWARVGDDAFFRVDTFLTRLAPAHTGGVGSPSGGDGHAPPFAPFDILARFIPGGPLAPALQAAYATDTLAAYPSGMGYIFSARLVRALVAVDEQVGLIDGYPEDGVAGLWMSGLNVARVDSPCLHDTALLPEAGERDWSNLRMSWGGGFTPRMPWEPPARRFNAGPCSEDSILVHYMTQDLWDAIGEDGVLRACGSMRA